MIKSGQKYRANKDLHITCMTAWRAPYTGGHEKVLPEGEEFIISSDPPEGATAVYADPVNYNKLHSKFVSWTDRIRFFLYAGYYLCIDIKTIEESCELLAEDNET